MLGRESPRTPFGSTFLSMCPDDGVFASRARRAAPRPRAGTRRLGVSRSCATRCGSTPARWRLGNECACWKTPTSRSDTCSWPRPRAPLQEMPRPTIGRGSRSSSIPRTTSFAARAALGLGPDSSLVRWWASQAPRSRSETLCEPSQRLPPSGQSTRAWLLPRAASPSRKALPRRHRAAGCRISFCPEARSGSLAPMASPGATSLASPLRCPSSTTVKRASSGLAPSSAEHAPSGRSWPSSSRVE